MFTIVEDKEKVKEVLKQTIKDLFDPIDLVSINKETMSKITDMDYQYLEENIIEDPRLKQFERKRPGGRKKYWLIELNLGYEKKYLRDTLIEIIDGWI